MPNTEATHGTAEVLDDNSKLEFCGDGGFNSSYQRNNKTGGKKHLRCFPCCGPDHKISRACEVALSARYVNPAITAHSQRMYIALARFLPLESDGKTICEGDLTDGLKDIELGADLTMARIVQFERTQDAPFKPLYSAKLVHLSPSTVVFEFRERAWHYGWKGGRYKQNTAHILRLYVFEGPANIVANGKLNPSEDHVRCVARLSSPPFTVYSSRSAPKRKFEDSSSATSSPIDPPREIPTSAQANSLPQYCAPLLQRRDKLSTLPESAKQPTGEPTGFYGLDSDQGGFPNHDYHGQHRSSTALAGASSSDSANLMLAHSDDTFDSMRHLWEYDAPAEVNAFRTLGDSLKRRKHSDTYYESTTDSGSVGNSTVPSTASRQHTYDYSSSPPMDSPHSDTDAAPEPRLPSDDPHYYPAALSAAHVKRESNYHAAPIHDRAPQHDVNIKSEPASHVRIPTYATEGDYYGHRSAREASHTYQGHHSTATPASEPLPFTGVEDTTHVSDGVEADFLQDVDLFLPEEYMHAQPPSQSVSHRHAEDHPHLHDQVQQPRLAHRASSSASSQYLLSNLGGSNSSNGFGGVGDDVSSSGDAAYGPASTAFAISPAPYSHPPSTARNVQIDESELHVAHDSFNFDILDPVQNAGDGARHGKQAVVPAPSGDQDVVSAKAGKLASKEIAKSRSTASETGAGVAEPEGAQDGLIRSSGRGETKREDEDTTADESGGESGNDESDAEDDSLDQSDHPGLAVVKSFDTADDNDETGATGASGPRPSAPLLDNLERDLDAQDQTLDRDAQAAARKPEDDAEEEQDVLDPVREMPSIREESTTREEYAVAIAEDFHGSRRRRDTDGGSHHSQASIAGLLAHMKRVAIRKWQENPWLIIAVCSLFIMVFMFAGASFVGNHIPEKPKELSKECLSLGYDEDQDPYAPMTNDVRHLPVPAIGFVDQPRPVLGLIRQNIRKNRRGGFDRRFLRESDGEFLAPRRLFKDLVAECVEEIKFIHHINRIRADKFLRADRFYSAGYAFLSIFLLFGVAAVVRHFTRPRELRHRGNGTVLQAEVVNEGVELTDTTSVMQASRVDVAIA